MPLSSHRAFRFCLVLSLAGLAACSRISQEEGSGSIAIQIPSVEKLRASGKVGALSVIDASKICFGVNIIGPGIASTAAGSCDVERGIVTGTVPAGGTLTALVDVGDARVFEVYGFLRASANDACPAFSASSWGYPLTSIFYLGKSAPTTVTKDGGSVNIKVVLPDASDTVVAHFGWPASCGGTNTTGAGVPGAHVVSGATLSQGSTLQTRARVSAVTQEKISQGSTLKVRAWKVGN